MNTGYKIIATSIQFGTRVWCSTPEFIGEAYGKLYPSKEDAGDVADELQDSLEEFDLDQTTRYEVVYDK